MTTIPELDFAVTFAELEAVALRVKAERDEAIKLLRLVLQLREIGTQGPFKSSVRAFLATVK